jgi:hypothetical protein
MKRTVIGAAVLAGLGLGVGACTNSSPTSGTSSPTSAPATSAPATSAPATTPSASPSQSAGTVAAGKLIVSGTYKQEAGKGPLELFTRLTGGSAFAQAAGSSEYDQEDSFREFDVFLTNLGGLAGHQVTVYLYGHRVGTMHVSGTGRAFRKWDTEHGQSVPSASAGSRVEVKTG